MIGGGTTGSASPTSLSFSATPLPATATSPTVLEEDIHSGPRSVRIHTPQSPTEASVLLNPDAFPAVRVGDCLEISDVLHREDCASKCKRCSLMVKVSAEMLALSTRGSEVSMIQEVADLYGFGPHTLVSVTKVAYEDPTNVDFLEVSVKHQYVSSSEMWRVKLRISGKSVFLKELVTVSGSPMQVERIVLMDGDDALSGIVTHDTKFTFRSKSAQIFWLVQLSREMWDFAGDGRLYFELILDFIRECLNRWKEKHVEHLLTIALFARGYHAREAGAAGSEEPSIPPEAEYTDFYRVILKSRRTSSILKNPESLIRRLKREFHAFPTRMSWPQNDFDPVSSQHGGFLLGSHVENSSAIDCNLLEAMNLSIDELDSSHVDRSLTTTGTSMLECDTWNFISLA